MIHLILPVGMLQCNCSIFGDEQTREAIVVDPGDEIDQITTLLNQHQLKVKAIVLTHAHIDHVAGAAQLRALTQAPVYLNDRDKQLLDLLAVQAKWLGMDTPPKPEIDSASSEGTVLSLGSTEFHVLETPGHTPGSQCLWIPGENKLVAGDTLFRESIGRTDLPGGDSRQILASIHGKLLHLPDDAIVIPGHGSETTIGHEKEFNPFLQA
jgi:hydroxyacylglutathione hydrolase